MTTPCSHLAGAARRDHGVIPSAHGCSECMAMGSPWAYCYPDEEFVETLHAFPGEAAQVHYDPPGSPAGR